MPYKEHLIAHLKELIRLVERSDGERDAPSGIGGGSPLYPFLVENFEIDLRRLDQKVNALLERPVFSCLGNSQNDIEVDNIQFMVGMGNVARSEAVSHMHDVFAGARQLAICDPYFLLPNSAESKEAYVSRIGEVIPTTVKAIELYVKPRKRDKDVADGFNKLCKDRGIRLTCRKTDELHDRVWIADSTRAFVIGASFNGLGKKMAFILELPSEDRQHFIAEVGLLRSRISVSKSA